jgi:DNA-binding transcriptional LysR family regulator
MVDFEWYRSFIAVYRTGTVTGASQARYLTQPAISQHIAALETAVGQALFRRTPRRMMPTEQGKALYGRVAPVMDELETMSSGLRDSATTETPLIRLGTPLDYFHEIGLTKLRGAAMRLQVELGDTEQMLNELNRGRLDAVIATQHIQSAGIDYTKIDQEEFCLVASPGVSSPANIFKTRDSLKKIEAALQALPWLSYSIELPIIRRFWRVAFKRRPLLEPVMIVPSLLLIRQAVEQGWGVSVLPRYICDKALQEKKLKILWTPKDHVLNDLWIATRKIDRNKGEIVQLITLMREA